jgi:hypothetical protein
LLHPFRTLHSPEISQFYANFSQYLEPISQFQPECSPILGDLILQVKPGRRIGVVLVEDIVDAGREFKILEQILAEKGEIEDAKPSDVGSRQSLTGSGSKKGASAAGVLVFESGENLIFPQRHA